MKATELRLGNWIQQDGKPYTLDTSVMMDVFAHWQEFEEMLFQPVPLTEEWLVKFGFKKTERNGSNWNILIPVWALFSFLVTIRDDDRLFYDWIDGNIELKYVHQLQNIYFALTGQELEIK